jgi:hypothetical protein
VSGESDLVTVFCDFDSMLVGNGFGDAGVLETAGWVLTDVGAPVGDSVSANSIPATRPFESCLRLDAGTVADTGGNAQLDAVNGPAGQAIFDVYPHIWLPESGAGATILDNTSWTFACRIGLLSSAATWDGKMFIGWAEAGDTGILTAATGAITQPETGPLVGFHVGEDGSIDGISQRTVNTAYAAGTNFTELYAAGAPNGNSGVIWWLDLAVRLDITDMSDNAANGRTTFYHRRVRSRTTDPTINPWIKHSTVLANQTPNNDVVLVPTIEVANGPANLSDLFIDWWAFSATRFSRR